MQQRRDQSGIIQPHFGQDGGDRNGMGEIRLARMTELALMHRLTISPGPTHKVLITARIVVVDQGDQVINCDHRHLLGRPETVGLNSKARALPVLLAVHFHKRAQHLLFAHVTLGRFVIRGAPIRSDISSSSGKSTSIWV